ncbi:hypothetical protein LguiB_016444 [Lonicera macranthoides]
MAPFALRALREKRTELTELRPYVSSGVGSYNDITLLQPWPEYTNRLVPKVQETIHNFAKQTINYVTIVKKFGVFAILTPQSQKSDSAEFRQSTVFDEILQTHVSTISLSQSHSCLRASLFFISHSPFFKFSPDTLVRSPELRPRSSNLQWLVQRTGWEGGGTRIHISSRAHGGPLKPDNNYYGEVDNRDGVITSKARVQIAGLPLLNGQMIDEVTCITLQVSEKMEPKELADLIKIMNPG